MNSTLLPIYHVLANPAFAMQLSLQEWDLLLPQLKNANLMARLCILIEETGDIEQIPEPVRMHLLSAKVVAEKNRRSVVWEVHCIKEALQGVVDRIILLKGGAYVMANVPASYGRIFSDVDILVRKKDIGKVENNLMMNGWMTSEDSAYNQKYYRKWMHEIPPMHHLHRKTTLDVHHAILPETSSLHFDPATLIDAAVPLDGDDKIFVLQPVDMVLHSATHLFQDGEFEHGLRDISDLDLLLRHYSGLDHGFWTHLVSRAQQLGLLRPMYYALKYSRQIFNTPIPSHILESTMLGKPSALMTPVMDALFSRALAPDHPSCDTVFTGLARWLLYIRAHYLRMPFYLLVPHLLRKALIKQPET